MLFLKKKNPLIKNIVYLEEKKSDYLKKIIKI